MAKRTTIDKLKQLVGGSSTQKEQDASKTPLMAYKEPSREGVVFKLMDDKPLQKHKESMDTPAHKLKTILEKQGLKVKYERAYHTNITIKRITPDKTSSLTFKIGEEMSENDAAQIEHKVNIELLGK